MSGHRFAAGDVVAWMQDGERRRGTITDCDIEPPSDAIDKGGHPYYAVRDADGTNRVVQEQDLEPSSGPVGEDPLHGD